MDPAEDDPEVRARLAGVRPELDPVVREVMRANARAGLFGHRPTIEVGRYHLLREVGTGGGGSVFVARDPELDREIAIKLIVAASDELRARAFSEGQALARLSHPNIVPVFDVGVRDERVYLVMELVRGESLRRYAERATVRQIVNAYRQAGEGLAAAHEAGLVHRDFKPDNAVIGADGRARVIDFGLARPANDEAPRGLAGTPRYMAPEQLAGQPATAASDQYAFAVSLREAVGEPLPRWLDAVVRRGANEDPDARFPDMLALLRALANDPGRRWRRRALIAAPLVLGVVGFAVGRRNDAPGQLPCDQGAAAIAPAWTAERVASADAHLLGLGTPFAAEAAPQVRAALAGYADRWIRSFDAACQAAQREPSPTVVERRSACLASARTRLGATIDVVAAIDVDGLPDAIRAIAELPDLDRCSDAAALVADVKLPPQAQAPEVKAITEALDRARVDIDAALPSAVAKTAAAVERARALGYRPLLAVALLAYGRAELAAGNRARAVAPLTEAVDIAIAVRDDVSAVEAHARLILAQVETGVAAEVVLAGVRPVLALAERLGPRDRFGVALLHNHVGVTEQAAGHRDAAQRELRAALALAREVTGPGAVELAWVRSNLAMVIDDPTEQQQLRDEGVAVARAHLGNDHPMTLRLRLAAAFALGDPARAAAGMREPCTALATLHPSQAPAIVEWCFELAIADLEAGAADDARRSFGLVIAADRADAQAQLVAIARAYVALLDGDVAGARRAFTKLAVETKPAADTPWFALIRAADVELGLAEIADRTGQPAIARTARARALAYLDRAAAASPLPAIARRAAWARGGT